MLAEDQMSEEISGDENWRQEIVKNLGYPATFQGGVLEVIKPAWRSAEVSNNLPLPLVRCALTSNLVKLSTQHCFPPWMS